MTLLCDSQNSSKYKILITLAIEFSHFSASLWLRYGFLKGDVNIVAVNVTAVTLNTVYLTLYYYYTKPRVG